MTITRNNRYQEGSIQRVVRAKGPDVWVFRWREVLPDGRRVQRKKTIGDAREYPTKAYVKQAVDNLRAEINAVHDLVGKKTVSDAWGHFQANELRDPDVDRSPTTIELYLDNFRIHLIPRWGTVALDDVKAVEVEKWLRGLPLAPATKSKLRNHLSALFNHAIRHELYAKLNPIRSVRQGSKRLKIPDILSLDEVSRILQGLDSMAIRTAVLVAAVTGLRRSEIRGLKWGDVDFDNLWLNLSQGRVRKHNTKLKTEASRRGIPISEELAKALLDWREQALYREGKDWIFASATTSGRSPMWLDIVLQNYIRPAARAVGINKTIGWHTFRRSLGTLLGEKGEQIKVIQELLRHANASTTQDLYQQAGASAKRAAQSHTSELFLLKKAS